MLTICSFEHSDTQSQLRLNHEETIARLASLQEAIQCANSHLKITSRQKPGEQYEPGSSDDGEADDAGGYDGVQTLMDCISIAETVRDAFDPAYSPNGKSIARFFDDYEDETLGQIPVCSSGLDHPQPKDASGPNHGWFDAPEFFSHHNVDNDYSTPLEVLSILIDDLREHAQNDLEAGNSKRAEVNLIEAIYYAEERESRHGVVFKDRVQLQEKLAAVYYDQKKWAEARMILHGLLQEEGSNGPELSVEKASQRSRQYLLLATIHHAMYLARPDDEDPQQAAHLKAAEVFAKQPFMRYKLRGATFDRQDSDFLETVQILIQIHEAQGRTLLAESWRRKFIVTNGSAKPVANDIMSSLSITSASDFDVIDIDELLISTIKQGDQSHTQRLLLTANVNCRCSRGRSPLMYAADQGDEITIRKLIDHGAEINASTPSGSTTLHQVVAKGNLRLAQLLLELDADIEANDGNKATPLMKALEKNHGLLVSYLLGQGADIHVKDKAGWTVLHHAAYNGAVDVLQHLLYPAHKMDVNAKCPAGKTALHYCAELDMVEPAKILLDHGAEIEAHDACNRSPLFFAVSKPWNKRREQFVNLLVNHGARVDPSRLPRRQRDYQALQNHPSNVENGLSSSEARRSSTNSNSTSATSHTGLPFLRRFRSQTASRHENRDLNE